MTGKARGFTLLELLVAMVIVAILAGMAYPAYNEYVRRAHRADISGLLGDIAHQLERFHSRHGQYSDGADFSLEIVSGNGAYAIEAQREDGQRFILTASPLARGVMEGDRCASFAIDHLGRRDNPGRAGDVSVESCWGR